MSTFFLFLLPAQTLAVNLAIGTALSVGVGFFYARFGRSLSNRRSMASIIPVLTLVTLLVISVIKSSLALSLGLVGALSIVRFRTAIKEPEELVFLFFAIAIGLGLGAEQTLITTLSTGAIMLLLFARALPIWWRTAPQSAFVDIHMDDRAASDLRIEDVTGMLRDAAPRVKLRRADRPEGGGLHLTYHVQTDVKGLEGLVETLRVNLPRASFSVIDQINPLGGSSA